MVMFCFSVLERFSTVNTNSLALEMVGRKLKKVKSIRVSDHPRSLKLIDGEIGSCQSDGVSVYDSTLTFVRRIDNGPVYDVALLPRGNVIVAGGNLCVMSKSGTGKHALKRLPRHNYSF